MERTQTWPWQWASLALVGADNRWRAAVALQLSSLEGTVAVEARVLQYFVHLDGKHIACRLVYQRLCKLQLRPVSIKSSLSMLDLRSRHVNSNAVGLQCHGLTNAEILAMRMCLGQNFGLRPYSAGAFTKIWCHF